MSNIQKLIFEYYIKKKAIDPLRGNGFLFYFTQAKNNLF